MKNDRPEQLPLARTDQLIVKEVDDEVLVYDLNTDQAHCLNKTAAMVWRNCDGGNSVADITRLLETDSNANVDENVVWLAMDELQKFSLLQHSVAKPIELGGMTRRQLMRSLGLAAVALPVIVSIVSPTAVSAASLTCGDPCGAGDNCNAPCTTCSKVTPTSPGKTCHA